MKKSSSDSNHERKQQRSNMTRSIDFVSGVSVVAVRLNVRLWKLTAGGKGTILHNFAGGPPDGCYPYGSVARDGKGNLYGTTEACGVSGYGTTWKLSAGGTFTLLHSFDDSDGGFPYGDVFRSINGTLYGTTSDGGTDGYGTVWSYVP